MFWVVMDLKKLKKRALEHLQKNWLRAILTALISLGFLGMIFLLSQFLTFYVALVVLLYLPLLIGVSKFHYDLSYPKDSKAKEYLYAYNYKNFLRSALGLLLKFFYLFWWTTLFVFPGLYKAVSYSMTNYILHDADFSHLNVNQAITKSRVIMNGHKTEFVVMLITFIPWVFVSIVTLGLGLFFLIPYFEQTKAEFYRELEKELN